MRRLERALVITWIAHGLGMVSMALLLLPGMPGGGAGDDLARMHHVAAHPGLWRLGWLPWQLTALSDLWLAWVLLRAAFAHDDRAPQISRPAAVVTAVLTVAGVIPDQAGQAAWLTRGLALAAAGDVGAYLSYEQRIFVWTAAWGTLFYTAAAIGWTWCLARARPKGALWSRALTILSALLWPLFLALGVAPLAGGDPRLTASANAVGFVLLEAWFALAIERVMRWRRPDLPSGRWAPWRYAHPGLAARALDALANSRLLAACVRCLPSPRLTSAIRDVIYVNYLVPAERVLPLVPAGLEPQRLGPRADLALFTFLTYRHGHLGPACLGPLRALFPSPVQSNWRIHVRDPRTGTLGVTFISTAVAHTAIALGGRLMVDGLPMHALAGGQVVERDDGFHVRLDPGEGSAPDADALLRPDAGAATDGPWRAAFASWRELLAYVVPQDRAFASQPWRGRICRLEIELGIPLDACQPLSGEVRSRAARAIAGDAEPFAFRVPAARFLFKGAAYDPLPAPDVTLT